MAVTYAKCSVLSCEWKCCKCFVPQRWLGVVLNAFSLIVAYCMRSCTHIAIVRMVKNSTSTKSNSECVSPKTTLRKREVTYGDNDWDQSLQGWILASFYIGYFPTHFPAGAIADKFGSRWILSSGLLLSIVCCFLYPIGVDQIGFVAVIFLRILQGIGQGVLFPAISANLGRWIPSKERSTASAIAFTGSPIGQILAILFSGILMAVSNNWRTVYYFWGVTSTVVYILIIIYYYSDPVDHPHITQNEAVYLQAETVSRIKKKTPYWPIILDGAILATIIGETGHMFPLFFFASNVPKYIDQVLRYPVAENALITSLPYLGTIFTSFITGWIADYGIGVRKWDVGLVRKIFSILSNTVPGFLFLTLAYSGCNYQMAIPIVVASLIFMGTYFPGIKTNTLDLTTQFAGFAMGLANGISAIVGAIIPLLCGYLAPDNTLEQWTVIFWILSSCCTLSTVLYIALASGKRRRWDYAEEDQKFFQGTVPWFTWKDGIDKDKLAVNAGKAAEAEANQQTVKT